MKMAKASTEELRTMREFMEIFEDSLKHDKPLDLHGSLFVDVAACWRRVVFGYEMLVNNCCDPDSDVLEWRADVLKLIPSIDDRSKK